MIDNYFVRLRESGSDLNLSPVKVNNAFATAAPIGPIGGSPKP